MWPRLDTNTMPAPHSREASFNSFKAFATVGGRGTVRSPDSDFGAPIALYRSARCRTLKLAFFEIHVVPAQPAQLGGPEPGKDHRQNDWAPAAFQRPHNGPDLFAARDISTPTFRRPFWRLSAR